MSAIVITLPAGLSSDGLEVAVTVADGQVFEPDDVLVRPAYSGLQWQRLTTMGGTAEVRQ